MKRKAIALAFLVLSSFSAAWAQTQRIQFPPRQQVAVIKGRVNPLSSKSYLLMARKGQSVYIRLTPYSPNKLVRFSVADAQYPGRTLPRAKDVTDWNGVIDETKDYLISVFALRKAGEESFTLEVAIPIQLETSDAEQPSATTPPCKDFSGTYDTNYGPLKLTRTGDNVRGAYTTEAGAKGTLSGTVQGNTLVGTWREPGSRGRFRFRLATDGYSFTGTFTTTGAPDAGGEWNGQCP